MMTAVGWQYKLNEILHDAIGRRIIEYDTITLNSQFVSIRHRVTTQCQSVCTTDIVIHSSLVWHEWLIARVATFVGSVFRVHTSPCDSSSTSLIHLSRRRTMASDADTMSITDAPHVCVTMITRYSPGRSVGWFACDSDVHHGCDESLWWRFANSDKSVDWPLS